MIKNTQQQAWNSIKSALPFKCQSQRINPPAGDQYHAPPPPPHPWLCYGFRPADTAVGALCRWKGTLKYSIAFPTLNLASLVAQMVKNPPAKQETWVCIPGSIRSPREGKGNPLQYSCLQNSKNRGDWQATVHGAAKNWAQLSN